MADAFAPQLGTEVRFNQPVETPSAFGALAELGSFFVGNLADTQRKQATAAPKVDTNLATFRTGLEKVEAIRQERGETAALVAERQLASNFAMAGINLDKAYEDVYTTTTGRQWAGYGQDVEATMLQKTLDDPQVQSSYIAGIAVLGPNATQDQLLEYAIGQKAIIEAANNEISKSKAQAGYQWSVNTEAAYGTAIDTFLNTSLGALSVNSKQGGRVSPMDVQNLKAQWGQLKIQLSRPSNISDDQWKSTQDKIGNIDSLLTTFEKASGSAMLLEELSVAISTAVTQGKEGDLQAMVAGAVAAGDITTFANLAGINFATTLMDAGKSLNLNVTPQNWFGHILDDQGSLAGVDDPNSFLSTIPDTVKTNIDGKTPEQIFNGLDASGKLTGLVKPADLIRPDAREQFVTNAATIGAVLMNNPSEEFLSDSFLKQLVANPGFIRNVIALDVIDPEGATVARQYVRSGLNTERGRQVTNFGTIEAYLQDKGIVWNGSAYALTPEMEASGPRVVPSFGGLGAITMSPLQENAEFIRQAMDRRAAIGTIDSALKALEVPTETTNRAGGAGSQSVGSVTAQLLDKFEGGGDYDALFGFANREGGPFAGTKVSEMTIGELKDFSNGEYADYSRQQLGYKATPMGRFQFVGTTLSDVAKRMGLGDDTVFTPQVQNDMFIFLAKDVMAGKSASGKRTAMRQTWEGLRNASDAELNQMIAEIEGGKASFGTTGTTGGTFLGARPTEANAAAAAAGGAVQRAVASTPSASMTMPSGEAPTEAAAATLPEAIPTTTPENQAVSTPEGQAPVVDKDVQAFIQEIAGDPDKTFASDAEFLAAQERGELEAGDTVVVDGDIYVIRKNGTARRLGSVNA